MAFGPRSVAASLLTDPVAILVSGLVFTTVSIALYAAAFDAALAATTRPSGTSVQAEVSGGTPSPGRPAAPTAANAPGRRTGPG